MQFTLKKNPKRMKYLMYLGKFKQIQEILITVLEVSLAAEVLFYPSDHFYTLKNGHLLQFKNIWEPEDA